MSNSGEKAVGERELILRVQKQNRKLRKEIQAVAAEKRRLEDENKAIKAQLVNYRKRLVKLFGDVEEAKGGNETKGGGR